MHTVDLGSIFGITSSQQFLETVTVFILVDVHAETEALRSFRSHSEVGHSLGGLCVRKVLVLLEAVSGQTLC